jgi:hypothetical protein
MNFRKIGIARLLMAGLLMTLACKEEESTVKFYGKWKIESVFLLGADQSEEEGIDITNTFESCVLNDVLEFTRSGEFGIYDLSPGQCNPSNLFFAAYYPEVDQDGVVASFLIGLSAGQGLHPLLSSTNYFIYNSTPKSMQMREWTWDCDGLGTSCWKVIKLKRS